MLNVSKVIFLWFLLFSVASAQYDGPLTITPSGYYLTVVDESGNPSYKRIETVIDLTGGDKPGPDVPEEEPRVDVEIVRQAKELALAVDDPQSAQAIALVYSHIRGAVEDGTLSTTTVWSALQTATDSSLAFIDGKDWTAFRGKLTEVFTIAKQRGNLSTAKQVARVLLSVQHGAELAADGSTALSMDQMVEIAKRTNNAIDGAAQ